MIQVSYKENPAINWEAENPVLPQGTIGFDTTNKIFKFFDGRRAWNDIFDCYVKNSIGLLASVVVNTNTDIEQNLYTVAPGKKCRVLYTVFGGATVDLANNADVAAVYFDFAFPVAQQNLSNLSGENFDKLFYFVPVNGATYEGLAGETLKAKVLDPSVNGTIQIDVFGYLMDA